MIIKIIIKLNKRWIFKSLEFFILVVLILNSIFLCYAEEDTDIINSFIKKEALCETYEDYDELVKKIHNFQSQNKSSNENARVHYILAKSRVDQLEKLMKQDNIKAARLYIDISRQYYDEAIEEVKKCLTNNPPLELTINSYVLRTVIYSRLDESEKARDNFKRLRKFIERVDINNKWRKKQIERVIKEFNKYQLFNFGNILNTYYIIEMIKEGNVVSIEELENSADMLFNSENYKEAKSAYDNYLNIMLANEDKIAKDLKPYKKAKKFADKFFNVKQYKYSFPLHKKYLELLRVSTSQKIKEIEKIGTNYFNVGEYIFARQFYNDALDLCVDSKRLFVFKYKIAESLRLSQNYKEALSIYQDLIGNYNDEESVIDKEKLEYSLAYCYEGIGDYEHALARYKNLNDGFSKFIFH